MKNLLLTGILFGIFSCLSHISPAQSSLKFIDGIELNAERGYGSMSESIETGGAASKRISLPTVSTGHMSTEGCRSLQFKYAQLLDTEIEALTNIPLFSFIEEWWNTRYLYGGSNKNGIDCSALTGFLLSSVYAIALPRTAREQFAASKKVPRENLLQGDLVFFNTRGGVSHVGVYLCNDYFVHASVGNGVTINNLNETYYANKYLGGGRMINTAMAGN